MINVSIILLIADAVRFSMFSTALSELSYGTLNTYIYKGVELFLTKESILSWLDL